MCFAVLISGDMQGSGSNVEGYVVAWISSGSRMRGSQK